MYIYIKFDSYVPRYRGIPIIADNATKLLSSRFSLLRGFGAVVLGYICNSTR